MASSWLAIVDASGEGCGKARDGRKGPLYDTHGGAARIERRRLRHLRGRIEGHKFAQFGQIGCGGLCGGGANGRVHGILPAIRTGESGDSQKVGFIEAGHGMNGGHLQLVLGQRAGFIRAQYLDARRFIHSGEPRGKHAQMGKSPRADCRREGEGGRQRYGDQGQNRRQYQGNDLATRHFEGVGITHQQHDEHAIEHGEISHHAQNSLLLRTFHMGGANQFRRAPELGARSGRRNLRHCLASPHQRSGIGFEAGPRFDGYRFAGEHGLVEKDLAFGQTHVRGNHGAER